MAERRTQTIAPAAFDGSRAGAWELLRTVSRPVMLVKPPPPFSLKVGDALE